MREFGKRVTNFDLAGFRPSKTRWWDAFKAELKYRKCHVLASSPPVPVPFRALPRWSRSFCRFLQSVHPDPCIGARKMLRLIPRLLPSVAGSHHGAPIGLAWSASQALAGQLMLQWQPRQLVSLRWFAAEPAKPEDPSLLVVHPKSLPDYSLDEALRLAESFAGRCTAIQQFKCSQRRPATKT